MENGKRAYPAYIKYCAVPLCKNNSKNAPNTIFFCAPHDQETRNMWWQSMRTGSQTLTASPLYCCEEHFHLEKDTENFIEYKIMKLYKGKRVRLRLKKGIVPHRFECQRGNKPTPSLRQCAERRETQYLVRELLEAATIKTHEQENNKISNNEAPSSTASSLSMKVPERQAKADRERQLVTEDSQRRAMSVPGSPTIKTETCKGSAYDEFIDIEGEWDEEDQIKVKVEPIEKHSAALAIEQSLAIAVSVSGAAIKTEHCEDPEYDEPHDIVAEGLSEEEVQSLLYTDHEIKEEIVIGPEEIQRSGTGLPQMQEEWFHCRVELRDVANELLCGVCGEWWLTAAELVRHRRSHATPPHTLPHSPRHEGTKCNRGEPPRPIPTSTETFICDHCGKGYVLKHYLRKHLHQHTGPKTFSCDLCGKIYCNKNSLVRHILMFHNSTPPHPELVPCDFCGKNFLRDYLKQHILKHTGQKEFSCDLCEKSFTFKSSLWRHVLLTHRSKKVFTCNQCNQRFDKISEFVTHQRVHNKHVSCNECGKWFERKSQLARHFQIYNNDELSCKQCHKRYSQKGHLNRHLQSHNNQLSCDQCDKRFEQIGHLNRHLLIHSGKKPFSCNQCDKQFSRNGCLLIHQRVHSAIKAFSCNQCDKQFNQKCNLTRHLRVHSGDKPYSCNQCDKRFGQKEQLLTHIHIHSRDQPLSCNLCDKRFGSQSYLTRHLLVVHSVKKP